LTPALPVAAAFLTGSIPFSWFIGRFMGVDLRKMGSGNPGATNLMRSCGRFPGILGLLLDALKGSVPVLLVRSAAVGWLPAAVAMAAILGHVLMPWFGFKGGKGVATALGALLVLSPLPLLCSLGVFMLTVALFRMVSMGSIMGVAALVPFGLVFGADPSVIIVFGAVAFVVILGHRGNIGRIIRGTERRLGSR